MSIRSPFFCSDLSRLVDEQTIGTASIGNIWLLLEYPFAWERKAVEESALSTRVKEFLRDVVMTLPRARVLLIKKDRLRSTDLAFYVVRSSEHTPFAVKFRIRDYEQLTELDIASIASGEVVSGGETVDGPLFLVCTHGRRDKCCAKFGYPLYKTLSASSVEAVWQSSHVGGDRFAANLVCLPHGLFYARVNESTGQNIIAEYSAGRIVLDNYRGRACYPHAVQAAEYFIRSETGLIGVDELRYTSAERLNQTSWRVRFGNANDESAFEADVTTHVSEFQNYITCDAVEEKPVFHFKLEGIRVARGVVYDGIIHE